MYPIFTKRFLYTWNPKKKLFILGIYIFWFFMSTFSSFVILFFLANFSVFDILCVDILSVRHFVLSTFCLSTFCLFDILSVDILSYNRFNQGRCTFEPVWRSCNKIGNYQIDNNLNKEFLIFLNDLLQFVAVFLLCLMFLYFFIIGRVWTFQFVWDWT